MLKFNPYKITVLMATLGLPALLVFASAATPGKATTSPTANTPTKPTTPTQTELEKRFTQTIHPFIQAYCAGCHGKDKPQAQLDLTVYKNMAAAVQDYPHWATVLERVEASQMPPADSTQPSKKDREAVTLWIRDMRQFEANRMAGDPGPVLARRLSNAEYDYTIRDLTGVDLHPTKEFPVDPANQEGFDNSGESLTMSPALMKKYVQAARDITDKMVLTTTGLEFASHPVLAETDRDKFCILRIVDFYRKQPTDYADYFEAAWRYQNRVALGMPNATLQTIAQSSAAKISPRYLDLVWQTLNMPDQKVGVVAKLQEKWKALPAASNTSDTTKIRESCIGMRDWVLDVRKKVQWRFGNLKFPKDFSPGGQCNILWKDRQYASHRRSFNPAKLQIGGKPETRIIPARRGKPEESVTDPVDPDLFVSENAAERASYLAGFEKFSSVFPDTFYVAERGLMEFDDIYAKGRLLTAGSHNAMGYFRDDTPLMELILDEKGKKQLETLWSDFDTVAFVQERMHLEFFFYERAESHTITDKEFEFARAEDKGNLTDEKIKLFADLYIAKAKRNGAEPETLAVMEDHFKRVSTRIRAAEKARAAAEPVQVKALAEFAAKAYRRPLLESEKSSILAFYKTLRDKEGLTHEEAIRDSVTSILVSPNFLYRMDITGEQAIAVSNSTNSPQQATLQLASFIQKQAQKQKAAKSKITQTKITQTKTAEQKTQPLPDNALANRLSYFLWSSMPDEELLAHAKAGDLHKPEVLTAQMHRMLKSPRVRALALEFGGNWLDFRRFEEHNAVDREHFPSFDDKLRESMFEEPIKFLVDEFQNNGSILDWLYGKHTFVNATLAKHYGMSNEIKVEGDNWVKVANADKYSRGGLFPMGVFLTKNASGLRTSPVRRGYWVVRKLLGEYIPPPPAAVPELPKDESHMGEKTLRQALEQHRQNPACAGCHARFDSYGLVFENFGPIGELRTKDGGGKLIDNKAPFPGGQEKSGVSGLQEFMHQKRQQDFTGNFARKMLSYALGRTLFPSDESLLIEMQRKLATDNYKFNTLVESIIISPQFRNRRVTTTSTTSPKEI